MEPHDKEPLPLNPTKYLPLAILIVFGSFGLIAIDATAVAIFSASWAESLKNVARCIFGALLYRGMVAAGTLDHLNDPLASSKLFVKRKNLDD